MFYFSFSGKILAGFSFVPIPARYRVLIASRVKRDISKQPWDFSQGQVVSVEAYQPVKQLGTAPTADQPTLATYRYSDQQTVSAALSL